MLEGFRLHASLRFPVHRNRVALTAKRSVATDQTIALRCAKARCRSGRAVATQRLVSGSPQGRAASGSVRWHKTPRSRYPLPRVALSLSSPLPNRGPDAVDPENNLDPVARLVAREHPTCGRQAQRGQHVPSTTLTMQLDGPWPGRAAERLGRVNTENAEPASGRSRPI